MIAITITNETHLSICSSNFKEFIGLTLTTGFVKKNELSLKNREREKSINFSVSEHFNTFFSLTNVHTSS